jgi:catechol 2,3-dioxygenase-like lactoylglutathione lyase family enzyme
MPITELNHYFVRANDLEATRAFYCDVLGLEIMSRPDFPFPGYWLGDGNRVYVHMGPHGVPNSELYYLGTRPDSSTENAGVVDHIAFSCSEAEIFNQRFEGLGIESRKRYLPDFNLFQMFVNDPNGLTVELNFFDVEEEPDWGTDSENYADMARVPTEPAHTQG